ncbi:transcription factor TFIIH complex subunit Ssl1 [Histoplasma capsulatum]|uniref:General transcription and DNA repair factor IIH n=1 Tax=Ajellomyces capsulatus TaxID=5037 RepID=A0A8A1M7I4_AJECA|nr:transcription factor TFIIH complex subunit Ssl1 [Histoplasma capsulatum]
MSDSDDEYVAHASDHDLDDVLDEDDDDDDDELDARPSASGPRRRRPAAAPAAATTRSSRDARKKQKGRGGAEWEVSRTWETLVESADGTISATVEDLLGAGKRKRKHQKHNTNISNPSSHTPTHGTREVLIIFGALLSSDPGDIHQTITALVADKIRISIIGLAAQVAICRDLCARTNNGDDTVYGVALNEQHFRELFMDVTAPPATTVAPTSTPTAFSANGPKTTTTSTTTSSLLMMGFPSLTLTTTPTPSLCACHSKPSRAGYLCCRCNAKVCTLPSSCPCCGLTLILSTHLARSYHHLFPLMNWVEVSWRRAARKRSASCFACGVGFPRMPKLVSGEPEETAKAAVGVGVSVSGRYECPVCECHFCIDCDVFAHEVVHNCPGCQSGVVKQQRLNGNGVADEMDTG